jgi:hypothetical protein
MEKDEEEGHWIDRLLSVKSGGFALDVFVELFVILLPLPS